MRILYEHLYMINLQKTLMGITLLRKSLAAVKDVTISLAASFLII